MRRGGVQERGRAGDDFNPRTPCGVRPCPPTSPVGPNCISIHAPRAGCDRLPCMPPQSAAGISIHAPRAGCDPGERSHSGPHLYFNPRTPCGVRRNRSSRPDPPLEFQSTHPVRGATLCTTATRQGCTRFQSTHPVRGATAASLTEQIEAAISIHAPRAGCDVRPGLCPDLCKDFNPRTPCGVRHGDGDRHGHPADFNPRTPCGVRRAGRPRWQVQAHISIHAPRAGCDLTQSHHQHRHRHFNPRTPCGVRPSVRTRCSRCRRISIHAPRAGCDNRMMLCGSSWLNFNPRTPCGVRPLRFAAAGTTLYFNPRTPCGVRPCTIKRCFMTFEISIHAPRAGCDRNSSKNCQQWSTFQSTHPVRGATGNDFSAAYLRCDFNPRTPCGVRLRCMISCASWI